MNKEKINKIPQINNKFNLKLKESKFKSITESISPIEVKFTKTLNGKDKNGNITPTEDTITHILTSEVDYVKFLKEIIDNIKKDKLLTSALNNTSKKITISNNEIVQIIVNKIPLRFKETSTSSSRLKRTNDSPGISSTNSSNKNKHITFYRPDYDSNGAIWKEFDITEFITILSHFIDIKDINYTAKDISIRLAKTPINLYKEPIRKLNLPPNHIILTRNSVVNLEEMEYSYDINAFGQYQFINILDFNILNENEVNKTQLEIVKRIMRDWSDGNPEKEYLLKQIMLAAVEGNGRETLHLIIGDGGNGKSSFLNIIETLVGENYNVNLEMHEYMDDNKYTNISLDTKAIIGHDLGSNLKMSESYISRWKKLITGEPFLVNVKYKEDRYVQCHGVKIQSTNTEAQIYENTPAVKRRLNVIKWTNQNFSELSTSESLTKLIEENADFYEAVLHYLFIDMIYFDKFIVLDEVIEATENMVNNADSIYQFVQYLDDNEIFTIPVLPTSYLYDMYIKWLYDENPGSKPLKQTKFTQRIKTILSKFGYNLSDKRRKIKYLKPTEFSFELIKLLGYLPPNTKECNSTKLMHVYENKNIIITDEEIDTIKNKLNTITVEQLSLRDSHIINELAKDYYSEAIELLEDLKQDNQN